MLTRVTLARLRATPFPTRSDFEIAARTLDVIRSLDPTDTDLLRRSIEAWGATGEFDTEMQRVRELLTLDPADAICQLRVTLDGIERSQDAIGRLGAYERLLGERGAALDPSVRSRLALDAALLARDNGDDRLYLEYLTLATTLDATNKQAAALYAGNLLQITTDPFERVDILANVILADPLDPSAYENLALELLRYGAFGGALRAFQLSSAINQHLGVQISEDRIFDFALCEWNVYGPDVAIKRLLRVLQDTIAAQRARRQAIIDDGRDPGPEEPVLLPPRLQLLRLAIAASEESETSARLREIILDEYLQGNDLILSLLNDRLNDRLAEIAAEPPDPDAEPADPDAEPDAEPVDERLTNIRRRIQEERLQRLWAQLAASDPEELARADEFITELEANRAAADAGTDTAPNQPPPLDAEVLQRYRGWLLVQQGEDAAGEALLEPLVERDHIARWAMGVLKEEQGLSNEAATHFAFLARDQPTTALGTSAFFRLRRLVDKPIVRSTIATRLDERIRSLAPWLEAVVGDAANFMASSIRIDPLKASPLDRIVIDLEISNTCRWPLAVGLGSPIPKRMLLSPRVRRGGRDVSTSTRPLVTTLSQRLRLRPAEIVHIEVHPLREDFGRMLDNSAALRVDARWQLLQNFIAQDESFRSAPMTISSQSDMLTRVPVEEQTSVEALVDRIGKARGADLISDILLAASMIMNRSTKQAQSDPQQEQERTMLASAIVARIPEMAEVERTLTMLRCTEIGMQFDPDQAAALHDAIAEETSPMVLLAALLGLAWTPDDPVFDLAQRAGSPEIARIATLMQESLELAAANGAAPAGAPQEPEPAE